MNLDSLLLLTTGGGAFAIARQFVLYPCRVAQWQYAFGSSYGNQRRELQSARKRKRRKDKEDRRQLTDIKRHLEDVIRDKWKEIDSLQRERDALLDEHTDGDLLEPAMGPLLLHERTLKFLKGHQEEDADQPPDVEETLTLADILSVDIDDSRQHNLYIRITRSDGTQRSAAFARTRYSEADVDEFRQSIANQVRRASSERSRRRERAEEIPDEIKQIKVNINEHKEATDRRCDELVATQKADPQRAQLQDEWQAACDSWKNLTGRRPIR